MAKLYPPVIEGIIPAFYGDSITIPYSMNKVVNVNEIAGFSLKIKTVQNNLLLGTLSVLATIDNNKIIGWDGGVANLNNNSVTFSLKEKDILKKLNIGQYYKVQLAYINGNTIGHYSTVGVVKYTSQPTVEIVGLVNKERNPHIYDYLGRYHQDVDWTEKVYSYNFKMTDLNGNVIADSGELLHNSTLDTEKNESTDLFVITQELLNNEAYYIQYTITTTNKMQVASPKYRIAQKQSVAPDLQAKLLTELNFENGYIKLFMEGVIDENGYEKFASGAFVLSRRKENEPGNWEEMMRFAMSAEKPSTWSWTDFTVEQGVSYIYSIQQYNENNLFSERILSDVITADFEHAFLFDGTKQLKIKYNPKVSSFKTTLLESKTDTLGSKHPFIFKNGNVSYKEFPISGLISYLMDEENLFIDEEDYVFEENLVRNVDNFKVSRKTTNLTGDNIWLERNFKINVLDWLNNGEPKLFRSPGEGNYVVRLLNTSLSPNDTLGRMLHTFSSTAYEVAEYNYNTLYDYGFITGIKPQNMVEDKMIYWASIDLLEIIKQDHEADWTQNILPASRNAIDLDFIGLLPGDQIKLVFEDNSETIIYIGATGSYKTNNTIPVIAVMLNKNNAKVNGILTYSYKGTVSKIFGLYQTATTKEVPAFQIFGSQGSGNVMELLEDIKTTITTVYYIKAEKRPTQIIFADNGASVAVNNGMIDWDNSHLYFDKYGREEVSLEDLDPTTLYEIYLENKENIDPDSLDPDKIQRHQDYYIDRQFNKFFLKHGAYIDNGKVIAEENYSTKLKIIDNSNDIDLNETEDFIIKNVKPQKLEIGSGLIATIGYCVSIVKYNFEDSSEYDAAVAKYENDLANYDGTQDLDKDIAAIKTAYKNLLTTLEKQLEEYKEQNGIE